jgi:hypothetical protein
LLWPRRSFPLISPRTHLAKPKREDWRTDVQSPLMNMSARGAHMLDGAVKGMRTMIATWRRREVRMRREMGSRCPPHTIRKSRGMPGYVYADVT